MYYEREEMRRSMKTKEKNRYNSRRKYLYLIIMLVTLVITGCTRSGNGGNDVLTSGEENITSVPQEESPSIEPEIAEDDEASLEEKEDLGNQGTEITGRIYNNGGLYVEYGGNIYYRQYTADNYLPDGLFGSYQLVVDSPKNMMRVTQDGITEVVFSDKGEGNIYIYKDRMYLTNVVEGSSSMIYSVKLDGSDRIDIGRGIIRAIDEDKGILVCTMEEANFQTGLYSINGDTGEFSKYKLDIPFNEYIKVVDDTIYYTSAVDSEVALGSVKLCSVKTDGTGNRLLVETESVYEEYYDGVKQIPCIQVIENTVYFSYGAFNGSAYVYQGGKIAKVNKDGSGFTEVLGQPNEDVDEYSSRVGDLFYVIRQEGKDTIYYNQSLETYDAYALDVETGSKEPINFPVQAEGIPFEYNGGVYIYENASPILTNLVPVLDYNYLGDKNEEYYYTVNDIEVCNNWVYYRLEASEYYPEASVGWRDGYRRIKTVILRRDITANRDEILFEY
jgi:hypothetical protein